MSRKLRQDKKDSPPEYVQPTEELDALFGELENKLPTELSSREDMSEALAGIESLESTLLKISQMIQSQKEDESADTSQK